MQQMKERVALTSMVASAGLTIAKAIVGVMTGSLAILSEAGHSFIDFIATVMTYFAVRISGKPADEEHHYGHGKVESVSALAETALLFVLSGIVIWEAARRLLLNEGHAVEATLVAFGVIVVSIVVDFFRARALSKIAKATSSEALEADALHFSSDMYSSMAVFAGLGGVALGLPWADAAAAVVVAVFGLLAGWRLGRRNIETLTDTAPPGAAETISAAAARIPGVVSVERVRARPVGEKLFVDLGDTVSRTLPLDRVTVTQTAVPPPGKAWPLPWRDGPLAGIFAQRGRNRPNRLGVSVCRIVGVDGLSLEVEGLDAIDGTPVLDIKPVLKGFLPVPAEGLTREFAEGATPEDVCARTLRALVDAGARHFYISNLPVARAQIILASILARAGL